MSKRITSNQILKAIGCPYLKLHKSTYCGRPVYFAFVYDTHPLMHGDDRPKFALWGTQPVHVEQLNHLSLREWAEHGARFASELEAAA